MSKENNSSEDELPVVEENNIRGFEDFDLTFIVFDTSTKSKEPVKVNGSGEKNLSGGLRDGVTIHVKGTKKANKSANKPSNKVSKTTSKVSKTTSKVSKPSKSSSEKDDMDKE